MESSMYIPPFSLMVQNPLNNQFQQPTNSKQEVFSELWNRKKTFSLSNKVDGFGLDPIAFDANFDDDFDNDAFSNPEEKENPYVSLMASVKPEVDLSLHEDDFFKIFDQNSEIMENNNYYNNNLKLLPVNEQGFGNYSSNSSTEGTKGTEVSHQDKIESNNQFKDFNNISVNDNNCRNSSNNTDKKECSSFLGKKVLFTSKKSQYTYKREIKLIQNRMSAKKCRQKKKKYVETLENEIAKYKLIVSQYQQMFARIAPLLGKIKHNECH